MATSSEWSVPHPQIPTPASSTRNVALRSIIFLPTDCVPDGRSASPDGNAPVSSARFRKLRSATVPVCVADVRAPTFSYGTGGNAYSAGSLQAGCDVLVARRLGIELFELDSRALVLSQTLIDQGALVAQGVQEFIGPVLLALQGLRQNLQRRIQEVEPAQGL